MRRLFWLMVCGLGLFAQNSFAQNPADTLAKPVDSTNVTKDPAIIYVIPAGPVAGSFTDQSRVQVVDTVAGWARILVEGWVPVEKVVGRMQENVPLQQLSATEKPKKVKEPRPQCVAVTAKGKQCTRKAIPGSKKCWQHSQ